MTIGVLCENHSYAGKEGASSYYHKTPQKETWPVNSLILVQPHHHHHPIHPLISIFRYHGAAATLLLGTILNVR